MPDGDVHGGGGARAESASVVDYARDVRAQIRDGDICLFREGVLHDRLIEIGTGSKYCHSALCFWKGDRVYVVQATAAHGVSTELLSEVLAGFEGPVELWRVDGARFPAFDGKRAILAALREVGRPYAMNLVWRILADILTFGLFKLRTHVKQRGAFICSQLVAWACRKGGVDLVPGLSQATTTPQDLVEKGRIAFQRAFAKDAPPVAAPSPSA